MSPTQNKAAVFELIRRENKQTNHPTNQSTNQPTNQPNKPLSSPGCYRSCFFFFFFVGEHYLYRLALQWISLVCIILHIQWSVLFLPHNRLDLNYVACWVCYNFSVASFLSFPFVSFLVVIRHCTVAGCLYVICCRRRRCCCPGAIVKHFAPKRWGVLESSS